MNNLESAALFCIAKHLENLVLLSALRFKNDIPEGGEVAKSVVNETRACSAYLESKRKL